MNETLAGLLAGAVVAACMVALKAWEHRQRSNGNGKGYGFTERDREILHQLAHSTTVLVEGLHEHAIQVQPAIGNIAVLASQITRAVEQQNVILERLRQMEDRS